MQTVPTDSIRSALEHVLAEPAYQWREQPHPLARVWAWIVRFLDRFRGLEEAHPVLYWLVVAGLTAVLMAILAHFAYLLWRALRPREGTAAATPREAPRRDARWYRAEAERLLSAGRLREALAADFRALLLALDARGALSFHPSKTPAEYIAELTLDQGARQRFGGLVSRLYGYLFAGRPCTTADVADFHAVSDSLLGNAAGY